MLGAGCDLDGAQDQCGSYFLHQFPHGVEASFYFFAFEAASFFSTSSTLIPLLPAYV
jgi:hypothetical protein